LNPGFAQAEIPDRFHQRRRLDARHSEEYDIGPGVPDPLYKRSEIGVVGWNTERADDPAAAIAEAFGESRFRIMAGDEVAYRSVGPLPALLRRPLPDWIALLPERKRPARSIGREPWNSGTAGGNADESESARRAPL
jgi:hypothetical protein